MTNRRIIQTTPLPLRAKSPDKHRGFNEETKYQTRYFVVYTDSNGEITKVDTGHVAAVSSSQAIEYGKSVLDSGKTSGTSGNYRYKTGDTDKGKDNSFMAAAVTVPPKIAFCWCRAL